MYTLNLIIDYIIQHWPTILSLLGGGAGLSIILEYLLTKFHVDSKKIAYFLIHSFSFISALALWYLDNIHLLPAYAGLVIAAQTVHRFIISPFYNNVIMPYLIYLSDKKGTSVTSPLDVPTGTLGSSSPDFGVPQQ